MGTLRTNRQKARAVRRQGKLADDPLVPLDAAALAAAVAEDGRSFGELAAAVAVAMHRDTLSKQRLHHLAHAGRRCRASLRRAVASVLSVGEDFLAGERRGVLVQGERATLAAQRDADRLSRYTNVDAFDLMSRLQRLYDVRNWRRALLEGDEPVVRRPGRQRQSPESLEIDDVAARLSAAVRVILRPLFKRKARLRRDAPERASRFIRELLSLQPNERRSS